MTAVLKFPAVRSIGFGFIGLALSCSLFVAAAPRAHAQATSSSSGLTSSQVSAIISLLQSFGADQGTISRVQVALGGGTGTSDVPSCTLRADPPAVAPGISTVLSWSSTGATSAQWTNDPSGKDNIAPPSGTPATSGSASFVPMKTLPVGMTSIPSVTLKVTGPKGSATCTAYISVVSSQQAQFDNTVFTQTPSATPTVSGTASGVTQVIVALKTKNGAKMFESGPISVIDGHWSITITAQIPADQYMIYVYNNKNEELTNGGYLTVTAQTTSSPITCSTMTSTNQVHLGETYRLYWASTNAVYMTGLPTDNKWPAVGSQVIAPGSGSVSGPYTLTFYGANGATKVCTTPVVTIVGTTTTPIPTTESKITANPTYGAAPFAVAFKVSMPSGFAAPKITYGDGGTGTMAKMPSSCAAGTSACQVTYASTHTYRTAGTYTVSGSAAPACASSSTTVCMASMMSLSGPTITVTKTTLAASPTAGSAPLTVKFTGNISGNYVSYTLDFGDGSKSTVVGLPPVSACVAPGPCAAPTARIRESHVYTSGGSYTAKVLSEQGTALASVTVQVAPATIPVPDPIPSPVDGGGGDSGGGSGALLIDAYSNLASATLAVAATPFAVATDLLSDMFLAAGLY